MGHTEAAIPSIKRCVWFALEAIFQLRGSLFASTVRALGLSRGERNLEEVGRALGRRAVAGLVSRCAVIKRRAAILRRCWRRISMGGMAALYGRLGVGVR